MRRAVAAGCRVSAVGAKNFGAPNLHRSGPVKTIQAWGRTDVEDLGVDAVAGLLHVVSGCGKGAEASVVVARLAEHLTGCLQNGASYASPGTLAAVLRSLAATKVHTPRAFAEAAKHITLLLSSTSAVEPHDVADIALSFSRCSFYSAPLFASLATYLTDSQRRDSLSPEDTLSLLGSMASLHHPVDSNSVLLAAIKVMSSWGDAPASAAQVAAAAASLSSSVGVLLQHTASAEAEKAAAFPHAIDVLCSLARILFELDAVRHLSAEGAAGLLRGVACVVLSGGPDGEALLNLDERRSVIQELTDAVARRCTELDAAPASAEDGTALASIRAVHSLVESFAVLSRVGQGAGAEAVTAAVSGGATHLATLASNNFAAFFRKTPGETVNTLHGLLHLCRPEAAAAAASPLSASLVPSAEEGEEHAAVVSHLFEQLCVALVSDTRSSHPRLVVSRLSVEQIGPLLCVLVALRARGGGRSAAEQDLCTILFEQSLRDDVVSGPMKASTVRSLCYAAFAAGTYPSSYFLNLLHLVRRRCAAPGHSSAELDACVETLLQYDESGEVAGYLADERVSAVCSASTPHAKIHMRVLPPGTPMRAQVAGWPMISHADLKVWLCFCSFFLVWTTRTGAGCCFSFLLSARCFLLSLCKIYSSYVSHRTQRSAWFCSALRAGAATSASRRALRAPASGRGWQ